MLAAALLAGGGGPPAFAQTLAKPPGGPASIAVGPLKLIPTLDLSLGYDDNLYFRSTNVIGSAYTVTSPALRLESGPGQLRFDATLRLDMGRYDAAPADNYVDVLMVANGEYAFTGRASLRLRAEHRHGHDPRGFTDRAASAVPDEWDNTGMEGVFRYGAQGAQGRIEIDAANYARRYANNRTTTAPFDRDSRQFGGTFYWRIQPKTELIFQSQRRWMDYVDPASTQDSSETRHYLGARWDATAATSGFLKFGRMDKKFSGAGRRDISDYSWDVGVRWSPRTYSAVDLSTARQTNESTGVGDAIISTSYGAAWNHAWSSRFRTQVLGNRRQDAFSGAGVSRQDTVTSFGLKLGYDFQRWLRLGAEWTQTERTSTAPGVDYQRNLLLFTFGASL